MMKKEESLKMEGGGNNEGDGRHDVGFNEILPRVPSGLIARKEDWRQGKRKYEF